jgi:hypothetical protein
MPTVQRYGERRVGLGALPGARKSAAATALSEGAGLAEADARKWDTVGRVASAAGQFATTEYLEIQQKAKERADNIARLSWRNRISKWQTDTVYNTENGVVATRGAAAQALPERVMGDYEKLVSEIESGLTSDEQRGQFLADVQSTREQVYNTVQSHVSQEITKLEANELTAFVDNQRSFAVANANNPRLVGQSLAEITAAIRQHGANVGMGDEQIAAAIASQRSAVHGGVIDRFLTAGNQKLAQVYFDETKSEISGESIAKIEKALTVGRVREQAQTKTEEILAQGGTLLEQRARAKAIDDPEVQDEVLQRLEHEDAVRQRAEVEAGRVTLRGAFDILDKTPNVARIPPNVWATLDGSERSALMTYARNKAVGEPIETNFRRYYELMQMAGSDPSGFMKLNLYADRAHLGDTEFKQLAAMQLSFGQGDTRAGEKDLATFSTKTQMLDDALRAYQIEGIDAKAGSDEAIAFENAKATLRRLIDVELENLGPGASPTAADIRSVIDSIMATEAQKAAPSPFWSVLSGGLPTVVGGRALWEIGTSQGWQAVFTPQQRRMLAGTTIADVPPAERREIEDALRRSGRAVSDPSILMLWQMEKVKGANMNRLRQAAPR